MQSIRVLWKTYKESNEKDLREKKLVAILDVKLEPVWTYKRAQISGENPQGPRTRGKELVAGIAKKLDAQYESPHQQALLPPPPKRSAEKKPPASHSVPALLLPDLDFLLYG